MARIMMKKAHNESISEAFEGFMLSAQSRGLTNKTLASYRTHFHSIFNDVALLIVLTVA